MKDLNPFLQRSYSYLRDFTRRHHTCEVGTPRTCLCCGTPIHGPQLFQADAGQAFEGMCAKTLSRGVSHLMQTACECKQTLRGGFRDIFLSGRGKNTTEAEKRELETCESGVEQWQDRKKKEAQAKLREEGGPVAEAVPEF